MIDWYQAVLLAIIQGLTEFLPISSSAHLVIPSLLLDWQDQGLAFDVAVHVGTLMAVLVYYRQDLERMAVAWIRSFRTGRQSEDEAPHGAVGPFRGDHAPGKFDQVTVGGGGARRLTVHDDHIPGNQAVFHAPPSRSGLNISLPSDRCNGFPSAVSSDAV